MWHVRSIGMATSSSQDPHVCHHRAHLHFLLLTKVLRGSWSVITRSFNIALNFGNGVKVRELKLRSRTQEQAVFGRHLCGCVFARRAGICEVALQQCMFGASRDKWSKIVSTSDKLAPLAKTCDKSHAHEHWSEAHFQRSLDGVGGGYPVGLCKAFEACICGQGGRAEFILRFLQSDDFLAFVGKQHRAT